MDLGNFFLLTIHNIYFYFKDQRYSGIEPMISMSYDYKV